MSINHKFYSGYFEDIRNTADSEYVPIAVCEYCPVGYDGLTYGKLNTPTSIKGEFNYRRYKRRYTENVLSKLNPFEVAEELCSMADKVSYAPIVLVFKNLGTVILNPRELIRDWFREAGIDCEELI